MFVNDWKHFMYTSMKPQGKARIRVQISAAHTRADIDAAVSAFAKAREACDP